MLLLILLISILILLLLKNNNEWVVFKLFKIRLYGQNIFKYQIFGIANKTFLFLQY